uniref:Uncharacterized mitochondrial protein AtMg00820-like n=1 Tax=Nicotiana tabacum TaxID=4097 RepID=A0A1S4A1P0_TOBAC|nr:PREDICTED: uncharacterized mitochondrial protein AtMg00820-like [Nicotiana tabacum]
MPSSLKRTGFSKSKNKAKDIVPPTVGSIIPRTLIATKDFEEKFPTTNSRTWAVSRYPSSICPSSIPAVKEDCRCHDLEIIAPDLSERVYLPKEGNKPFGSKWIFRRKMKTGGIIDKYKARLIAKGLRQREGLDYFDTYSPVTRITSIRMVIELAIVYGLEIYQVDIKTTFLNGDLDKGGM